ncbi:MAG: 4Fe-4S binding protein [Desulfobacterales bacterium]|nr:4Fe-4S binding protein [Desulfobacterales bacterium]
MKIDKVACIGCEACHPYCPVNAITSLDREGEPVSEINQDECVECGACLRAEVCPTDAIQMPELDWPRSIRALFSNPLTQHPSTKLEGRGTEEMKTTDVTGRFRRGMAGVGVEMGRPGIGTTFRDLQTVCMALAKVGAEFEPENPVTSLIADKKTGEVNREILGEKALSAIIEFPVKNDRLAEALKALRDVSSQIDTVFSLCLISRVYPDGSVPVASTARQAGFILRPNTKTNVGLGRPLKEEI